MRSVTHALLIFGFAAAPVLAERPDDGGAKPASAAVERRSGAAAERREAGRSNPARSGGASTTPSASRDRSNDRRSGQTLTEAQRRHPRAGTGTGYDRDRHRGRGHGGYGWNGYGYGHRDDAWGFFYNPYGYGNRWGYGYYPYSYHGSPRYYGSSYYGGSYYGGSYYASPYRRYDRDDAGSLRIIAEPERTRVYVDGYYAGIVDDFDGIFQRLTVSPGRHEIALKLDGYRTQVFRVHVPYESTIKLHHEMVRGAGEDRNDEMAASPRGWERADHGDDRRRGRDRDDFGRGRRDDDRDDRGDMGTLRLDVRPANAAVYVDDQFRGTGNELTRLRLPAGRHRVEIVRPGYRTLVREVDVRAGDESELELELDRS